MNARPPRKRRRHAVNAVRRAGSDAEPAALVPEAHLRYARWLARGTVFGFVVMLLGFAAYVGGVLDPHVALEDLPTMWHEPAASYLERTGIPHGWGWIDFAHKADVLNLAAVAILSGCSAIALLAVIPVYARERSVVFVAICLLEIMVMALAASNIVAPGH